MQKEYKAIKAAESLKQYLESLLNSCLVPVIIDERDNGKMIVVEWNGDRGEPCSAYCFRRRDVRDCAEAILSVEIENRETV